MQRKKVKVNQTEANQTNVLKHELLTCPSHPNTSQISLGVEEDQPKVCEYGTFQDYRMQHGKTELVSFDKEENTVLVNRTWLELPNLRIPAHSDTYCVRKSYILFLNLTAYKFDYDGFLDINGFD